MGLVQELKQGFHEIPMWGWGALAAGGLVLYIYESRKKAASAASGPVSTSSPLNVPMVPATTADASGVTGMVNYLSGVDSQNAAQFQSIQQSIADEQALIAQMLANAGSQGAGSVGAGSGGTGGTGGTSGGTSNPVFTDPIASVPVPDTNYPPSYSPPPSASYDPSQSGQLVSYAPPPSASDAYAQNLALLNQVNPQNQYNVAPPPPPPPIPSYPALAYNPPPSVSAPITYASPATPVNPPVTYSQPVEWSNNAAGSGNLVGTDTFGTYLPPLTDPYGSGVQSLQNIMNGVAAPPPIPTASLAGQGTLATGYLA